MTSSEKVFTRLLRLYPARFREEYGESMLQHFRDLERASCGSSFFHRAGFWVHIATDTVVGAVRQWLLSATTKKSSLPASTTMRRIPSFSFLFVLFLIPLIAGLLMYVRMLPRAYVGTVRLLVTPLHGNPAPPDFAESQLAYISSVMVLQEVARTTDLARHYSEEHQIKGRFSEHETVGMLRRSVQPRVAHSNGLIEVRVFMSEPDWAAQVANQLAETYRKDVLEMARVDFLDRAERSFRPVRPNVPAIIILGSALCVFLAAIGAGLLRLALRGSSPHRALSASGWLNSPFTSYPGLPKSGRRICHNLPIKLPLSPGLDAVSDGPLP